MSAVPRLEHVTPVLMVRDVRASLRFYTERLGFGLVFQDSPTDPRYAGVRRDTVTVHLQWHDAHEWSFPVDRPTYRFLVQDVDGLHREFSERGIVGTPLRDTTWQTREFHVQDPDANGLQFYRTR